MYLHKARSRDMGVPQAVPVSEVLSCLKLVGIVSEMERVKYLRIVQKLDSVYLDHQAEKAAKTKP